MDRLAALKAFLKEDPEDPFTRFALASEYWKRGDTEEALRYFEHLVAEHPDYVGTYYHLAGLYRALGRTEEARSTYNAGIRVASGAGDRHSESELRGALMELDLDF